MTLVRRIMFGGMYLAYGYSRLIGWGPFGRSRPVYLHDPPPVVGNALKAALQGQHVRQYHEASCSVASVATMINAIRAGNGAGGEPVTQLALLDRVRCGHWKERMRPEGHNGRRGLPLGLLGEIVAASLAAYGIRPKAMDVVPALSEGAAAIKRRLRNRLRRFEDRGDCLLLVHFNQGALVPALSIPHISPVGGYDSATDRVTLLDVDPDQPAPYSVTFARFYQALACQYLGLLRPFGYDRGGYVFVQLGPLNAH
jgi:hypothetical protein